VSDLGGAGIGRLFQTTPLMINDNIANCIACFLHESQDFSFRQLPPGWPPIPLLARRLSRLKVVVSTFQKSVCRALNASAASIQNMRVDHRRADIVYPMR
jgi:hypothetical protein